MKRYNSRSEVEPDYKWNLSDFFKDEEEYKNSFLECEKKIKKLNTYKGKLKDPIVLKKYFDEEFSTEALLNRILVYSYIINDQELGNSKNIAYKDKAESLINLISLNTNYAAPEILSFTNEEYEKMINDEELAIYHDYLIDIYRFKEHVLSENEESIASQLINACNNYADMASTIINLEHDYGNIVINNEKIKITTTNYRNLMRNKDASVRKKINKKLMSVIGQYDNTMASYLNSYVKMNLANANIHHYDDVFNQELFSNKMTKEVYNALIKNVINNTKPLQKYYQVLKKGLKLDSLSVIDLYLELTNKDDEYSISEAQELCLNAIKPLGEDYYNHFKKIFDNHYIDYASYPGKANGAYSISPLDLDSRILMSYNGDFESVTTIIHEGGHNVHQQYINEGNALPYRYQSSTICEVASLTNECLLSLYLINNGKNVDEKITGASNLVNVVISNLYGAVREGKIEFDFYDEVKKGSSITADYMNKITKKSYQKFYGDTVKLNRYSKYSWITRSHYFMNYYLPSYAFSIMAALNISDKIINGDTKIIDNYLKFLKCGSNVDTISAYQILGIDLKKDEAYLNAIKVFDEVVDKLDQLIDERK